MGVTLPSELAWVLGLLGLDWPNADEDRFRAAASAYRQTATEVDHARTRGDLATQGLVAGNRGAHVDALAAHWSRVSEDHLGRLVELLHGTADALDGLAVVVEGAKAAVVVQLGVLAGELAAAAASSIVTFGLSDAAALAATQLTRVAVSDILREAEHQLLRQAMVIVGSEVASVVAGLASEAVQEEVSDYLGTGDGLHADRIAAAGWRGGVDGARRFADPANLGRTAVGLAVGAGHDAYTRTPPDEVYEIDVVYELDEEADG
jgi:hypothetical protein